MVVTKQAIRVEVLFFAILSLLCFISVTCGDDELKFGTRSNAEQSLVNVFVVPQSHCDVGWLYSTDEYFDIAVKDILDSVVEALMKDKSRRFVWVEVAFLERWWRQATDSQRFKFRYLLENGQIEFVIGGWVMQDEALTTYSADINQMTHGHQFLLDTFGDLGRPRGAWQIDPFGAAGTTPSMFKEMGLEYSITARIDYELKEKLKVEQKLEFVWQGSQNLGNETAIFGHILDNSYCTPTGFDFEGAFPWGYDAKNNPKITSDNIRNRSDELAAILHQKAKYYSNNNNLLFPYGCDFEYRDAELNFGNMTLLMDYINQNRDRYSLNMRFTLLSDYFDAILKEKPLSQWPVYKSDFTPYADNKHSFWTGYYTSRPVIKEIARYGERIARTGETLFVMASMERNIDRWSSYDKLYSLRSANGEVQHHDAITGTEKPNVTVAYIEGINNGVSQVENVTRTALSLLLSKSASTGTPLANLTRDADFILHKLQPGSGRVPFIIYNSLGWSRSEVITVITSASKLIVFADELSSSVIPSDCTKSPESPGFYELRFRVDDIPALGFKTIYIGASPTNPIAKSHEPHELLDDITISNDVYDVTICASSQSLCKIRNKKSNLDVTVNHEFLYYPSFYNSSEGQTSGAYIFRPLIQEAQSISEQKPEVSVYRGNVYEEVRLKGSNFAELSIRLFKNASQHSSIEHFIDLNYKLGTLKENMELISRFSTSINNQQELFTDSNALETVKRIFNASKSEPVSANYYATQYSAFIRDISKPIQLTVLSDRSHGVASINNGQIEMMLHRRCIQDDFRGVGTPLDDQTVIYPNLRLILDTPAETAGIRHQQSYFLNFPVDTFVVQQENLWKNFSTNFRHEYSPLNHSLPTNLHILTMEAFRRDSSAVVLRFANIYEQSELNHHTSTTMPYSDTINVNQLFGKSHQLIDWIETYLSTNRNKNKRQKQSLLVTLKPIEIKTYVTEFI